MVTETVIETPVTTDPEPQLGRDLRLCADARGLAMELAPIGSALNTVAYPTSPLTPSALSRHINQIRSREKMPVFTVPFQQWAIDASVRIDLQRNWFQMGRANAGGDSAKMINNETLWDRPNEVRVRKAMSRYGASIDAEQSVIRCVERPVPNPALHSFMAQDQINESLSVTFHERTPSKAA